MSLTIEDVHKAMMQLRLPNHMHYYVSIDPLASGYKECICGDAIIEFSEECKKALMEDWNRLVNGGTYEE